MMKSVLLVWFAIGILGGCAAIRTAAEDGNDSDAALTNEAGRKGTDVADTGNETDTEDKSNAYGNSGSDSDSDVDVDFDHDSDTDSGASDKCDDGLDNNVDGNVDEYCPCEPRSEQDCYGGPPALAGIGECTWGTQQCESSEGMHLWGDCVEWGAPSAELCEGFRDENCDGQIDEGCLCRPGAQLECYDGAPQTEGVSHCHGGYQACHEDGKSYDDCTGQSLPQEETCDLTDEDCDGWIDNLEACLPCLRPQPHVVSVFPWQEHSLYGQQCYPAVISPRCVESEYNYALSTPGPGDSGWVTHSNVDINWSVSTNDLLLGCDSGQGFAGGGQFTYFQTFFYLGSSYPVSEARVSITNVDDGVRIALYNDIYPNGVVVPGGYLCQNVIYTTDNFYGYLVS